MNKNLKVSVVIPCYNRMGLIGQTIENMLMQTLPPHEIIVVDDGSTDSSIEVVKEFGKRVTLIEQENRGPGSARNTGFKCATGDFIQFMDSDDIAALNKLEVQAYSLEMTGADFAYSPWIKVIPNGQKLDIFGSTLQSGKVPDCENLALVFLTQWSLVLQICLFRRRFIEKFQLFRSDIFIAEDLDFFLRIFLTDVTFKHTPETLTLYRVGNEGSLTSGEKLSERSACDQVQFLLDSIALCQKSKKCFAPLDSVLFRQRLWAAGKSLQQFDSQRSVKLVNDVKRILKVNPVSDLLYVCRMLKHRYSNGIRRRLKGYRESPYFAPGDIDEPKIELLNELGYTEINTHQT